MKTLELWRGGPRIPDPLSPATDAENGESREAGPNPDLPLPDRIRMLQLEAMNKLLAAGVAGAFRRSERARTDGLIIGLGLGLAIFAALALLVERLP